MRFNKMTSYAIRVVGRMSLEKGKVVTSNTIASKENIPKGVLMKVLRQLKEAGIIVSHQGRGELTGGFSLAKDVSTISIYDLIAAMEGDVCLYPSSDKERYKAEYQNIYKELRNINEEYIKKLDTICIGDVI